MHTKFQLEPFTVRFIFATWHNLSILSASEIIMEKIERVAIRFCWKAGFNATKTFKMIQKVYGEPVVHHATVFHWYNTFSEGWESIHDEQRNGRLTMRRTHQNIARVADILKEDCRSSCRLTAEWMGISKTIMQQILCEDLQKRILYVQFVPYTLTAKQKEQRLNHTWDRDPNFSGSIIIGDESWCFACDLETKCQSSKWYGPNTPPS